METSQLSLEELMQSILDGESTQEIMDILRFQFESNHQSEEMRKVAEALHTSAEEQIAATTDGDMKLAIARGARAAFGKASAAHSEEYCRKERETWEDWRKAHYEATK